VPHFTLFTPSQLRKSVSAVTALALAASSLLVSRNASANIGLDYGFGPRTAALAGAGAAYGFGAFAAYHNPAGLPFKGEKRLLLQLGVISMNPSFIDIGNVVTENDFTSDQITHSNVDTDYRSTLGEELGLVYSLFPEFGNLTFGIVGYLPFEQIAYMDTGETYVPEYVLYRARTQRPQVELGLGADVTRNFHVGVGLHVAFALTGAGTVFLQTEKSTPSTMRFSASLKPKVAPQFGLLYTSDTETDSEPPRFTLGAVLRLPVTSDNAFYLRSAGRFLGKDTGALDFHFDAVSALFYDPLTIEIGTSFLTVPEARTYLQIEFQGWSKFEPPALLIVNPTNESCPTGNCAIPLSEGQRPAFSYRNIIVPRIGEEIQLGRFTLRAGYAYKQSIFNDDGNGPSGAGNYLDPSKHVLTAGVGYHFDRFLSFDVPCDIDFNFAYHHLITQRVVKTAGDERGTGAGSKIGAPGYEAGGKIYGGGVSLSLAL
jgi:hypothetical protein